ncbi:MAG: hypothetical protein U1E89_04160 [Burkholderiaceae bacterium]
MALARSLLRRLAVVLAATLLLAQWATAAYVCPRGGAVDTAAMAAMPDCPGRPAGAMDTEQPQLCKAHCEQGTQSVNATPQPEPATSFSVVAVLDWRTAAALPLPGWPAARAADASAQPPPGATPLYLTLRVLRD